MTTPTGAPPRLAERILWLVLPRDVRDPLLADLAEAFAQPSRARRRRWYWGQVTRACWPPTLIALHLQHRPLEAHRMTPDAIADALRYDTRLALRGFRRRPLFTAMIAATLALGIGANTTMFGVLDRLLLQPPPHIADPDRVVLLHARRPGEDWVQTTQPYVVRTLMAEQVGDFADVAVATPTGVVRRQYYPVGRGAAASRVAGSLVSANYFSVLGVRPALGRFFLPDEENDARAQKLVVLGYGYWQRQYAGSPSVLGQTIEIGTSRFTIVGVTPDGFTGTEMRDVDVWLPIVAADGLRFVKEKNWTTSPSSQWLLIIARLKPNALAQHAESQATVAYRNWMRATMRNPTPERLAAADSQRVVLGSVIPGKSLWTWGLSGSKGDVGVSKLLAGVAFVVLLIACANVANLLLVRAIGRRREIAVRLALGVSRRRLLAQLMVEGMLLSLLGVAGALVVTAVASPFVRRWLIGDGAWTGGALSTRILLFTLAVGFVTGVVTSLVPAMQASSPDVAASLKAGARDGSVQRSRTRNALLVAQAALAIMLLSGAGMFIRSLRNVAALDLGVDVDRVLTAQINQGVIGLSNEESRRLFAQFAERARAVPGISDAAVTVALPFSMSWGTSIHVPGRELPKLQDQNPVQYAVGDAYFSVLGIHTLMGRAFTPADREGSAPVAMINETMARLYWPNHSPIGACVQVGGDTVPCTTVVGVVTNTRRQDLVEGLVPQIYRPLDQLPPQVTASVVSFFGYTLIARTSGDAAALVEPLRRAIQSVGPSVPYANVQTMRDLLGRQTRSWELGARVFTAFGALALLLAGVGLFSVVAFTIGQRMHELGVRTALGARRGDLLRLTIVRGVTPAVVGVVTGIALTLVAGRLLESMLFQVSPRDPATLGLASAIMLVCALLASLAPAWRASRVDPTIALRAD